MILLCALLVAAIVLLGTIYYRSQSKNTVGVDWIPDQTLLLEQIQSSQNEDGGFSLLQNIYADFPFALYSTYQSYSYINNVRGLSDEEKDELTLLLEQISEVDYFKTENTYDDVNLIFYYLELCKVVEYNSAISEQLIAYVLCLQDDKGFFYRSAREQAEFLSVSKEFKVNDPITLTTTYRALQIIDHKASVNTDALSLYYQNEINQKMIEYNTKEFLSCMSSVFKAKMLYPEITVTYEKDLLDKELNAYTAYIQTDSLDFIEFVEYLDIISLYKGLDLSYDKQQLFKNINTFIEEGLKEVERSIYIGIINDVCAVLKQLNYDTGDLNLSDDGVQAYKNYDGSYILYNYESDPIHTYYVLSILSLLDDPNAEEITDTARSYVAEVMQSINRDAAPSNIYLVQSAILSGIPLNNECTAFCENLLNQILNRETTIFFEYINMLVELDDTYHFITEGSLDQLYQLVREHVANMKEGFEAAPNQNGEYMLMYHLLIQYDIFIEPDTDSVQKEIFAALDMMKNTNLEEDLSVLLLYYISELCSRYDIGLNDRREDFLNLFNNLYPSDLQQGQKTENENYWFMIMYGLKTIQ